MLISYGYSIMQLLALKDTLMSSTEHGLGSKVDDQTFR